MCDPATLAITAAVVTAGSTVYSGAAAKAEGKYIQAVEEQNAQAERDKVADAYERGDTAKLRRYRQLSQSIGQQRAAAAAAGLDVNFGSAFDTQLDSASIAAEDIDIIGDNTRREAEGFDISAANAVSRGAAARARGNAAFTGSIISAGSTLLGGASQLGGYKGRTPSAPTQYSPARSSSSVNTRIGPPS